MHNSIDFPVLIAYALLRGAKGQNATQIKPLWIISENLPLPQDSSLSGGGEVCPKILARSIEVGGSPPPLRELSLIKVNK